MTKLLIAGPAIVDNERKASRLKSLVWHYLSQAAMEDAMIGDKPAYSIICADDTATGRYAKMWSHTLRLPVIPYSAKVDKEILSQNDRDLIHIRNMKMVSEPDIVKAIIFNHTNECSEILSALQNRKNAPIEIMRVMG